MNRWSYLLLLLPAGTLLYAGLSIWRRWHQEPPIKLTQERRAMLIDLERRQQEQPW